MFIDSHCTTLVTLDSTSSAESVSTSISSAFADSVAAVDQFLELNQPNAEESNAVATESQALDSATDSKENTSKVVRFFKLRMLLNLFRAKCQQKTPLKSRRKHRSLRSQHPSLHPPPFAAALSRRIRRLRSRPRKVRIATYDTAYLIVMLRYSNICFRALAGNSRSQR